MLHGHRLGHNLLALITVAAAAYFGIAATRTGRAVTLPPPNTWTCSQGDGAQGCSGTVIAPMPTPRARLVEVTAPGGTLSLDTLVYAIGGYTLANGGVVLNTFEAYDPTTNSWLTASTSPALPVLPTARASLAAVLGPDGQTVYTFGGANQREVSDGTLIAGATAVVEAFNPNTGTWACSTTDTGTCPGGKTLLPLPTGRVGLAAATGADGLIYTFGGYSASTSGGVTTATFFSYVEAYNPVTNTWICSVGDPSSGCTSTQLPAMPTPRGGLRAVLGPDGQTIYALGGFTAVSSGSTPTYTFYSVVEALHPQNPLQNSAWTCSSGDSACATSQQVLPSLFLATQGFGGATAGNGAIYAFGGSLSGQPLQSTNANQVFIPTTLQSIPGPTLPTARRNLGGTLGPDGLIYAIGGTTSASPGSPTADSNVVEAFLPPTTFPTTFVFLPVIQNGSGHSIYLPIVSN
jgi:Kelch motif